MKIGEVFNSMIGGVKFTYLCTGHTLEGTPIVKIEEAKAKVQPEATLIKSKGTGEWHVCVLNDRIWTGVSPWFKSKNWARKWAIHNGYKLVKVE